MQNNFPRASKRVSSFWGAAKLYSCLLLPSVGGCFVLFSDGIQPPLPDFVDARGLTAGDIDQDGDIDIIAVGESFATSVGFGTEVTTLSILENTGDDSFPATVTSIAQEGLRDDPLPSLSDVDGDGALDLMYRSDAELRLLPGDGQGAFGAPVTLHVSPDIATFVLSDLDGDDLPEVVLDLESGDLLLFQNQGGGFGPPQLISQQAQGGFIDGDFDADGDQDLITLRANTELGFLQNDGAGNFTLLSAPVSGGFEGVVVSEGLAARDVNSDDSLDIVLIEDGLQQTLFNDGGGLGFSLVTAPVLSTFGLVADDLNQDQDIDLVIGASNSPTEPAPVPLLLSNQGDGSFVETGALSLRDLANSGAFVGFLRPAAAVDLEGDGDLDLVFETAVNLKAPGSQGAIEFNEVIQVMVFVNTQGRFDTRLDLTPGLLF